MILTSARSVATPVSIKVFNLKKDLMKFLNGFCFLISAFISAVVACSFQAGSAHAGAHSAGASAGRFGLGAMLGDPTTLTFKYWTSASTAIDGHLGSSFGNSNVLMADYLWHFPGSVGSLTNGKVSNNFLPYVGVGGVLFFNAYSDTHGGIFYDNDRRFYRGDSAAFGARVPFGIEYLADQIPFGFFLELAPGITIVPRVVSFLQAGIGARFYF